MDAKCRCGSSDTLLVRRYQKRALGGRQFWFEDWRCLSCEREFDVCFSVREYAEMYPDDPVDFYESEDD